MLVLASASPRRKQLLQQIGVEFTTDTADIDETPLVGELALAYVKRMALNKAKTVYQRLAAVTNEAANSPSPLWVLGSDTSVILEGEILGKPTNKADAVHMLSSLSGRTHSVLTSVALMGEDISCIVNKTQVSFCTLSAAQIDAYWHTGEPIDKAGSYAIQGKAAVFIENIQGSFSAVMGLPLYETAKLLTSKGLLS